MLAQLLIVEDDDLERKLYGRVLSSEGHHIFEAASLKEARTMLQRQVIHVIILDVNLPDGNGLEFISETKQIYPEIEIILFTSRGSIPDGVKSIKLGAFDYIVKGDSPTKLIAMTEQASKSALVHFMEKLSQQRDHNKGFSAIIGNSLVLQSAKELAKKVAKTNANVLLLGETGVGKDLFAEAIHMSSLRHHKPFLAINCSAFSKEILESELFGYKAGAFTGANKDKKGLFEMADEGTIFLDEIGEMSIDLQARILRVLQNKTFIKLGDTKITTVDCRLIAATNLNLLKSIQLGTFREDLYYRISSFTIKIPPLRERDGDVQLLIQHLVNTLPPKLGMPKPELSSTFMKALTNQPWKGNVRELINVIERAIILSEGFLDSSVLELPKAKKGYGTRSLEHMEKDHINGVLAECGGNKRQAANKLGIAVATLYRKLDGFSK